MALKKILVRAGIAPWETMSTRNYLEKRPFASNIGNIVYAYGVCRMLMTDPDTEIDVDHYRAERNRFSQREIDRINETYSCYVVPLADAFRPMFLEELSHMTTFIRKLKIPVVVIGVGMKATLEYGLEDMEACNEAVRNFVNAVLEKSSLIGLRGEYTAEYLGSLGYRAEEDFTPIGCPSVYAMGGELPIHSGVLEERGLNETSSLVITNNLYAGKQTHGFLNKVMEEYPNYIFIPQLDVELSAAYYGRKLPKEYPVKKLYPLAYREPPYSEGKVFIPFQFPVWIDLVKHADLAAGPRLHGSIVCMLAGVPTLVIARDTRMLEVCRYHHFAHVKQTELTDETSLKELVEKADFQAVSRNHARNFAHYCDFLEKNGIEHRLRTLDRDEVTPLDRKVAETKYVPVLEPYCMAGTLERRCRDVKRIYTGVMRRGRYLVDADYREYRAKKRSR